MQTSLLLWLTDTCLSISTLSSVLVVNQLSRLLLQQLERHVAGHGGGDEGSFAEKNQVRFHNCRKAQRDTFCPSNTFCRPPSLCEKKFTFFGVVFFSLPG